MQEPESSPTYAVQFGPGERVYRGALTPEQEDPKLHAFEWPLRGRGKQCRLCGFPRSQHRRPVESEVSASDTTQDLSLCDPLHS